MQQTNRWTVCRKSSATPIASGVAAVVRSSPFADELAAGSVAVEASNCYSRQAVPMGAGVLQGFVGVEVSQTRTMLNLFAGCPVASTAENAGCRYLKVLEAGGMYRRLKEKYSGPETAHHWRRPNAT